ncbi:MAG: flagellar motor protein MotB [Elusimicrobiota bacterium]|nr:flagellar motor protein MotB [Elusimicrobiota bacterium]
MNTKYSDALKFFYADMITNLLLFFLMLWSFTLISPQLRQQIFAVVSSYLKESPTKEIILGKTAIKEIQKLQIDETRTYVIPPEPITFQSGAATLTKEAIYTLELILPLIRDNLYSVLIEGHTDNKPILSSVRYKSNRELSSARAFAVLQYLIMRGVSKERLGLSAYGETKPIADNFTAEGRKHNRRIDLVILSY